MLGRRRVWWAFVAVMLLAACGRAPDPTAAVKVTEVTATTQTSVKVTFDRAVGQGADRAENYVIEAEDGTRLAVLAAYVNPGATSVMLATAPQQPRTYRLSVSGVSPAGPGAAAIQTAATAFGGSSDNAPIVASAIALNNTQVLVTFAFPPAGKLEEMGPSALNINFYDITEDDPVLAKTPDLTIESIAFADASRTSVILTTEPQKDVEYTVRVTNVLSRAGDKLIDPYNSSAAFRGIPADDTTAPRVLGAVATSNTTVVVYFSEQVTREAANAQFYDIRDPNGDPLPLDASAPDAVTLNEPARTQATLKTLPMLDETVVYTVTVTGVMDMSGNLIDPNANSATFSGISKRGPIDGDVTPPRVANTGSTGNTTVLVTFSEPVQREDAEKAEHYHISANLLDDQGLTTEAVLVVTGASLSVDRTTVFLTTLSQSDIEYTLEVTNVKDLSGNQIAPPERGLDPSALTFVGTPPGGAPLDSDGDGLSDEEEQRGWIIAIRMLDGSTQRREVTSDPGSEDTDEDGILDADEKTYGTNPRNRDSDDDGLTDYQELNEIYSDPAVQDSDDDGLADGLEANFFYTSALLDDTDGDQFLDGDEVVTQNRNALVADMPMFDIAVVGDVQLGLDVRFVAESSSGRRHLDSVASNATLTTSDSRTVGSENASSTEWFINAGAEVGFGYDDGFTFNASVKVEGGYKESTSTTFKQESVRSTQQEQARSMTTEAELNNGETLTREVVGASMAVALQVNNTSDLAFTLSNVEILAKIQDPRDPTRFVPIATLTSDTGASINIGPAPFTRGPFRFSAADPAPALIESLRENPRGLVFEIVNYDVTDEFGRNFTFTAQDVNDRTATLVIDYNGYEPLEVRQVATHSPFDGMGKPIGITMRTALEDILGLEFVEEAEDVALVACLNDVADPSDDTCSAEDRVRIDHSYSTRLITSGPQADETVLWRVRSVMTDTTSGYKWFTTVDLPAGMVRPDDFNDFVTKSGTYFQFIYGQDVDGDGLSAREEALYGSVDTSMDSDLDGVNDDEEIRGLLVGADRADPDSYEPWLVRLSGAPVYRTSASPGRFDTDLDGLTDCQELGQCPIYVYLFDADGGGAATNDTSDPTRVPNLYYDANGRPALAPGVTPAWTITLPADGIVDPGRPDTDGDGLTDLREIVGFAYEAVGAAIGDPFATIWPSTDPTTDTATDPLNGDTDGDGLGDGDEARIGTSAVVHDLDKVLDNDGDGLVNIEEDEGWDVTVEAVGGATSTYAVTSGRNTPDTDNDGLSDREERDLGTDPRETDTDGDGLTDLQEVVGVAFPSDTVNPVRFTDPLDADSDDDGRSDGLEALTPWTVAVVGEAPFAAYSDPLSADADLDGLLDGDEAIAGTNPNKPDGWDTDGDGVNDYREVMVLRGGLYSNPLQADQVVSLEYANMTVLGGCPVREIADADAEYLVKPSFRGLLKLEYPDGTAENLANLIVASEVEEGQTINFINARRYFVVPVGYTFRAFSGPLEAGYVFDGIIAEILQIDEGYVKTNDLGNFSKSYDFPAVAGSYNQKFSGPYEGDTTYDQQCEISISWIVRTYN